MRQSSKHAQPGFTLVEMIVTIVLLSIVASMVAVFIRAPAQGYSDAVGRAEMSDLADTVMRRIARDIRIALPNSVRVSGDGRSIEMLATRTGGRYLREEDGASPALPVLDFLRPANTTFTLVGDVPSGKQAIFAGDRVVVFNLGPGYSPADAYAGGNSAAVVSVDAGTKVVTLASNPFGNQAPPMPSPSGRFQVVSGPVRYVCAPGANGSGTLRRHSGYAIVPSIATAPAGGVSALAANWVTGCQFNYVSLANTRTALVVVTLTLQKPGGADGPMTLTHQVHVDNTP
jgi:MSHA biogenesis protein MshO